MNQRTLLSTMMVVVVLGAKVIITTSNSTDDPLLNANDSFFPGLLQLGGGSAEDKIALYQDPFCMSDLHPEAAAAAGGGGGSSSSSHSGGQADARYEVHSFAILHRRLYVLTATAIFNVSLDQPPPFRVDRRTLFTDFNRQLSNMLYSTPLITSQVFTSVGIEIDEEAEVLVLGVRMTDMLYVNSETQYVHQPMTYGERMRDIFVLHNRLLDDHQPKPEQFTYDFSARLADVAHRDAATNESWNANRFIVGANFFYFIEVDAEHRFNISHYVVGPNINFTISPVFVFEQSPQKDNQWLFAPTAAAIAGYRQITTAEELIFAKNGFIHDGHLYLADWASHTTYTFSYEPVDDDDDKKKLNKGQKGDKGKSQLGQMRIKSESSMPTWALVDCHLANPDRLLVHLAEPLLLLALLVLALQIALGKRATLGRRVIIGPALTYYEINDQLLFSKYGSGKG